jgi:hypothetical protein
LLFTHFQPSQIDRYYLQTMLKNDRFMPFFSKNHDVLRFSSMCPRTFLRKSPCAPGRFYLLFPLSPKTPLTGTAISEKTLPPVTENAPFFIGHPPVADFIHFGVAHPPVTPGPGPGNNQPAARS